MPSRRNLCVAVAGPTMAEAVAALARVRGRADMVELRLDLIQDYDLEQLLAVRECPAVVTLRPERQGGAFNGDEAPRLAELRRAARLGAEWIDIELDAADRLGPLDGTMKIVSHHDFAAPPPRPDQVMAALWAADGHAAKLAVMVHQPAQLAPLLQLADGAPRPSIILAMGAAGAASRVLCLRSDACLLTYVAIEQGRGTAPGQITLDEMEAVYHARAIGRATRALGYLGPAEGRSALASVNGVLVRKGLNAVCVPLGPVDARQGLEAIEALALDGGIVPPALEAAVAQLLPALTSEARAHRQVNTILNRQAELVGAWAPDLDGQLELLEPAFR